ncbi:MAG TPA: M48 family metalloprotease [Bacteroidales bacterium]|nr:M48 family metalloprotease [Bacteroidales bacterium]
MIKIFRAAFMFIAATIVFSNCAVNPVTGKSQIMLMSEAQETKMGQDYDPQVVSTFGLYQNDAVLNFVSQKGNEMGKISHRPNLQYNLKLLDSPVVNAFAVPGGYIYLTRGILAQLNNEAELIGVIGHEMGHVTARHSASQQTKQQLGQLLLIGGMLASERFAQYANQAMQGMQLLFLKFSRDDERQADALGVEYMSKIGYDAHRMADFFQVLNKMSMAQDHGGVPTFMSTHPDPGDRYNSVNKLASSWQDSLKKPEWVINSDAYLKMIDGMIYGDDPRQGYTESNIFYHPELKIKFSYPAGWQFQNSPMQVATAPSDGKAMIIFTLATQKTADEASKATIAEIGLSPVESKTVSVNGLNALSVLSKQVTKDQSGQQQVNQLLSYYIEYAGKVFVFHGVSTEADFKAYQPMIESTLNSFAALTDQAKLNVKPRKIVIKTVTTPGTFAQVLTSFGVAQQQMAELSLLNNIELTANVQPGKLVKTIGQ